MPELLTREPSGAASRPPSNRNGGRLQPGMVAGFTSENMAKLNRNLQGVSTVGALLDVADQLRRAAELDRAHNAPLRRAEMPHVGGAPGGSEVRP